MGARLLQCGATPSAMFDPSVLSKNGAWERHLASWPGVPWYLYRQGQWHETLKSGAGRGLLFHFQAPFWSDIASVFPLVVLVSRLAALWRLRVRGECRRGSDGVLCGDADQPRLGISDTTCCMGTYAAAAGFPFRPDQKDTTTRQSSSSWLPGARHGKTHARYSPEQTPGPRFFLCFDSSVLTLLF